MKQFDFEHMRYFVAQRQLASDRMNFDPETAEIVTHQFVRIDFEIALVELVERHFQDESHDLDPR